MTLTAHPRLHASGRQLKRLRRPAKLAFLAGASRRVARDAAAYVASHELHFDPGLHNGLLTRAREMQKRVVTLLVRWLATGEGQYRSAAIEDIREMGRWAYWSAAAASRGDARPEADFDLSYGENSATLAIAYDWLFDTLSVEERQSFRQIAQRRSLGPLVALFRDRKTEDGGALWWFAQPSSNWNSVCAGGAGMLALAMFEELPECSEVLAIAEKSIAPYMQQLEATGGGWPEGIGYWNYGHRYAFMYLMSHEHATGRPHPLLLMPAAGKTLKFPLDFCPNGVPCSFGDVNQWTPLPFHYAAALRLRRPRVLAELDAALARNSAPINQDWPDDAEWLVFHSRTTRRISPRPSARPTHYPGIDWFALADRMPEPRLYVAARGGTTRVPHSHLDLLSFHCVIQSEQLVCSIGNLGGEDYLDTTFSRRRNELFEMSPNSKNGVFINGVGIAADSSVQTSIIRGRGFQGVRMDATGAMGLSGDDRPAADFCGRLFLLLETRAFLIVDRFELPRFGRVESRLHTWNACSCEKDSALIRGKKARLRVTYACTAPAALFKAVTCPTTPRRGANVLRWCTRSRTQRHVTMATLLWPGADRIRLGIEQTDAGVELRLDGRHFRRRVRVSARLDRVALHR